VVAKKSGGSGGIWFSLAGTSFLVDSGLRNLVRVIACRPKLNPTTLDGMLLNLDELGVLQRQDQEEFDVQD
jgi:hypothetical protein